MDKVQRSYYLTPEQAKTLKIAAVERGMTASDLLGSLIEQMYETSLGTVAHEEPIREVHAVPKPTASSVSKQRRKATHEILAKIGKQ
jgi:hypothetical protein